MRLQMTDHFTYDELTRTDKAEFQEENRKEGTTYLGNLLTLATELEKLRKFIGRPVIVYSAFRCPALNELVGGSKGSQHLRGEAADFAVDGYRDRTGLEFIFEWCRNHLTYRQIILEVPGSPEGRTPWIHIGVVNGDGKVGEALVYDGKEYSTPAA